MTVKLRSTCVHFVSLHIRSFLMAGLTPLLLSLGLEKDAAASTPPSVSFFAAQSVVSSSSLNYPYRVAADASGDVYICDTQANRILKETLVNGSYAETVIVPTSWGLTTPYGITVTPSGIVYVADNGNTRIVKLTPSSGSYTISVITTTTSLSFPTGIASDASGNLYIADTGGGKILIEVPSGSSYTETALTYGSNFTQITGIAVDASGNIYVSDIDNQAVYMETYSEGSYTPSTISTSGLNYPYDITVDASGNLYIADFSNDRIVKETYVSPGSYTQSVLPTASLSGPLGLNIGGDGNLYIADTFGFSVKKLQWAGGGFGPVNVNSAAGPVDMLFQFYGGSEGATRILSSEQVVTQGAPSLDFTDAGSGNCSTSSAYSAGQFCWVDVNFTPMYPGIRMGAAQLLGAENALLANGYVNGMGIGPQLNYSYPSFDFSIVHEIAGSYSPYNLSIPFAAVVDAQGNLYIADYANNEVYKETLSEGDYTQSTVATELNNPEAVAVDGAGNVYICDSGDNQILLETYSGGGWVQTTIATELNFPTGVAVDATGDVYYSSFGDGAVYKITQSDGVYSAPSTAVTGLNQPRKIAVDALGNIYIADTGNSRVLKETFTNPGYTQSVIGNDMLYPYAVAVAADGTVFVADTEHEVILAETWTGSGYTQSVMVPGPVAYDIQVDEMGNLIFPEVEEIVFQINYVQTPSLSFASTGVDDTSTDSPQTIGITNVGNASLSITAPESSVNPSISSGFVLNLDNEEACPSVAEGGEAGSLAVGAICTLSVSFEPVSAGADNGAVSIVTDSLYTPTTNTVSLSGTGNAPDTTSTAVTIVPGSILTGGVVNISATVSDTTNGGVTPTGSVTFTDIVGSTTVNLNGGAPVALSSGVASLSSVPLTGIGTHTITATYGGTASFTTSSGTSALLILDYTVTSTGGGGNSITATPGGAVSNTINITPSSGSTLPTAILLAVTGLPNGATASVTPDIWVQQTSTTWTLPAFSALAPVTLHIQLPATMASLQRKTQPPAKFPPILWALLLLPLARSIRRMGRRLNRSGQTLFLMLCALAGLAAISSLSGCGSASGFFGQAQQSYTVTETITAGANSQSTSFTLIVE